MDTSHGPETPAPVSPSRARTRQTISWQLSQQTVFTAARCCPFSGIIRKSGFNPARCRPFRERRLLLQPQYQRANPAHVVTVVPADNTDISTASSTQLNERNAEENATGVRASVPVAPPADNTDISTASSTQLNESNAEENANGVRASYLRYVNGEIKQVELKLFSYDRLLHRMIGLIYSKIDSYASALDKNIKCLNLNIAPGNKDRKINLFYSEIDSYSLDLERARKSLHFKTASCRFDLETRIKLLNSKLRSRDQDLHKTIQRLNYKAVSYNDRLNTKLKAMNSKLTSFNDFAQKLKERRSRKRKCRCVIKASMCGFVCSTFRARV